MNMRIIGVVALAAFFAATATAGTILDPTKLLAQPDGYGTAPIIMSLQTDSGGTDLESGCVSPDGSGAATIGSAGCAPFPSSTYSWNTKTIDHQYATPTLGSLGITSFSNLMLLFNIAEPDNALHINSITLGLFTVSGGTSTLVDTFVLGSMDLTETGSGVGTGDYAFRISGASVTFSGNYYIGLAANISGAADGADSFRIMSVDPDPVPDAPTAFLIGTGLITIGTFARRRLLHR